MIYIMYLMIDTLRDALGILSLKQQMQSVYLSWNFSWSKIHHLWPQLQDSCSQWGASRFELRHQSPKSCFPGVCRVSSFNIDLGTLALLGGLRVSSFDIDLRTPGLGQRSRGQEFWDECRNSKLDAPQASKSSEINLETRSHPRRARVSSLILKLKAPRDGKSMWVMSELETRSLPERCHYNLCCRHVVE